MGQAPVTCCSEPCSAQPVQMIPPVIATECVHRNGKQGFAAMKSIARADIFASAYAEKDERLPLSKASVLGRLGKTSWQKEQPLTPELPTLLPQRKNHGSLVLGGKESSSDLSRFVPPPQPSFVARAKGDSLQPSVAEDPWKQSWPRAPVLDMTLLDHAPEAEEGPKRAKSALTQWYDGASETPIVSLCDVREDHSISLGDVIGFPCDADTATCVRREATTLTCWYGDVDSNASTLASPSEPGDSDEGSCRTHSSFGESPERTWYLAPGLKQQSRFDDTSDGCRQEWTLQEWRSHATELARTNDLAHKRTDRVEPRCRPTSIETEVFFLFDPSFVADN
jgi:hypothetical protein